MTTQTSPPTDNERLARLEGAFQQFGERLSSVESQIADLREEMRSQRNLFITLLVTGFGIMWATMVAGFIAILTFNS